MAWPIRRARTRLCGPPPARRAPASRRRQRRSCWSSASWSRFPSVAWHAAEDLEDHPEVVLGFEVVVRGTEVDPGELPRADPVVVLVPAYRRLQIAHDDPELHRFVEDGLSHCSPPLSR